MSEFTNIELIIIKQLIANEKYECEAHLRHHKTDTVYVETYQNRIHHCQDVLDKIDDVLHAS